MPTYEYLCLDHGHRFEVFQHIGEEQVTECPECAGPVRKVFHPVGVVLKGSGFYRTDSRSKPAEKPETKKSDDKKPADKKKPEKKEKSA
jgi:putative FmdB family regulatory protein